jgi:hypothetical protein
MLNGSMTPIEKFPSIALNLYKRADQASPNRAINTLGMARAHDAAEEHFIGVALYQQLLFQMTSSNHSDNSFLIEINEYLDQHSSAMMHRLSSFLVLVSLMFFTFH